MKIPKSKLNIARLMRKELDMNIKWKKCPHCDGCGKVMDAMPKSVFKPSKVKG